MVRFSRVIVVAATASLLLAQRLPASPNESFTRGPLEQPQLVVTFDGGSNDRGAREVLDALRERGIHTTIFLTGEFIENYPELTRQIVADGHEVGNHTYTHPHLVRFENHRGITRMTRERFESELLRTSGRFREVTGRDMAPYWRAPYGEENAELRKWAAALGYVHVGWTSGPKYNLDALDWVSSRRSRNFHEPDQLARRILNFDIANRTTLNGAIILMHLGSDRPADEQMNRALPSLLDELARRGFRFVKVSELRSESAVALSRGQP